MSFILRLSLIGAFVALVVNGSVFDGKSTEKEINNAIMASLNARMSAKHRLLLAESGKKHEFEKSIAHAVAEALIVKAHEHHSNHHHENRHHTEAGKVDLKHISDADLRELAEKWAKKLKEMKKQHDHHHHHHLEKKKEEKKTTAHKAKPTTTKATVEKAEVTGADKLNEDGAKQTEEEGKGPVVLLKDLPAEAPPKKDAQANNQEEQGGEGEEANNGSTRHIVINFSTESLLNLWAIVAMILVINVVLYCCYTRRKQRGAAFLARSDMAPDDV